MTHDHEIDALVADRYLDALLASAARGADDAPADAMLDPGLRDAAGVLRRALVRVHPSFRFEERLGSRLAELGAVRSAPVLAAAGAPPPVPFHLPAASVDAGRLAMADPLLAPILRGELDPADADAVARALPGAPDRRPLLVGGAITSAAISLVGVAIVAWRASRPTAGATSRSGSRAMVRAARAARASRISDGLAEAIGSIGGPA